MKSIETKFVPAPNLSIRSLHSRRAGICLLIFLTAFGVRLLSWHDTRLEVGKVQTAVTGDYQRVAQLLRQGGFASFLSSSSPLSDLNTLGHPPGYSILMAAILSLCGESSTAIQFVQIICDALAAVMIFLIAGELLPVNAATLAGMLAAFSPQFAWNSVLLLPDSLAVLPILLAIYCLARSTKNPRFWNFIVAGALVGLSCWLRANAMLLTFFVAGAVLLLVKGEGRWRYALAVVFGTLLIVLPLTIRNAIVFHRFIPLSLGAGQTLLEGISDYDRQGKFGIPNTDIGIMKQEAEQTGRPDYYGTLFNPDGVERERARLSRGLGVVRSHPLWFAGVMARRATSMLRLERSRMVSTEPPVSHSLARENLQPVWTETANELFDSDTSRAPQRVSFAQLDQRIQLVGDDSKYGEQLFSDRIAAKKDRDYVFSVPVKMISGRMRISVITNSGKTSTSTIVEAIQQTMPEAQPVNLIQLAFVSSSDDGVHLSFANEASIPANPIAQIGDINLFDLGPARFLWTRYPRFLVHGIQKIFLTAVMLPLAIIGLGLLIFKKDSRALIILGLVPVYFFCVQSIVHTEYRYVLAVDYFLFALVGVAVGWSAGILVRLSAKRENNRSSV
jgi:dolichyl-phosphate-mannose-protein mannosyltransferase